MRRLRVVLIAALLAAGARSAGAFPQMLVYQGRYLNAGVPTNGPVSMEFRITNGTTLACGTAANGASLYWTSGAQSVVTSSGVFSYKLGLLPDQATQDPVFAGINWGSPGSSFFIDVCVAGTSLVPHEPIGSGVFALYASSAGYVSPSGLDASSVTLQGNSFNAANRLVRLDASGRLPGVDGSLLTNVSASSIAAGAINNSGQLAGGLVIPDANLPSAMGAKSFSGLVTASAGLTSPSSVTASAFFGDGSHLSGVNASLPAGTYSSALTLSNPANVLYGDGSHLTSLPVGVVAGTGLSLSGTTMNNTGVTGLAGGGHVTASAATGSVTLGSDATASDTAGSIVARDGSGGFSAGAIAAASSVTASAFFGDGSHLTGVSGTDVTKVSRGGDTMTGSLVMSGVPISLTGAGGVVTSASSITASAFFGSGSGLTSIPTSALTPVTLQINAGSGLSGGGVLNTTAGGSLTLSNAGVLSVVAGTHLTTSGSAGNPTIGTDATAANTAGTLVARDGSGGFSAGAVTSNSSMTASAFFGDGSHLSGISAVDATKVAKSGDTMTGALNITNAALNLTGASGNFVSQASVTASAFFGDGLHLTNLPGSSMTLSPTPPLTGGGTMFVGGLSNPFTMALGINSSAFIANGSTPQTANLSITGNASVGGNIGVGTASPVTALDVNGAAQFGSTAKSTFTANGSLQLASGAALVKNANGNGWSLSAIYCGATAATTGSISYGGQTGYYGAALACQAACSNAGSHMCTAEELVRTYSLGGTTSGNNGWYATGLPGTYSDCGSYTTSGGDGPYWSSDKASWATCNTSLPILCCN